MMGQEEFKSIVVSYSLSKSPPACESCDCANHVDEILFYLFN